MFFVVEREAMWPFEMIYLSGCMPIEALNTG